jgi:hypothetical protein
MDKHLTRACAGIALAALTGQFLLGCDSAGSSRSSAPAKSPGASASVPFPVAVGDTWTYTLETLGQPLPSLLVKKITGITPVPRGRRVSMAITYSVDGIPKTIHQDYLVGTDGSISFPPPGPVTSTLSSANAGNVIVPPLSVVNSGRPVTWTVKMPPVKLAGRTISGETRITMQGGGTASVTVPAGTYRATLVNMTIKATTSGVNKPAVMVQRMWFAPHVGEVGEEVINASPGSGQVVSTLKLRSFTGRS